MKIALCTELRNAEWFESRLRSLFEGEGPLAIDELWNENQLAQALRRSRYHAVVIAMTGARDWRQPYRRSGWHRKYRLSGGAMIKTSP